MSIEWDLRRTLNATLPDPELRAKASSSFTIETIDARLAYLSGLQTEDARREVEYLLALRQRKFPGDPGSSRSSGTAAAGG